jgi:phosphatidylglycerophosphatase A
MPAQSFKEQFALLIAEFFFCGRSPVMPGTIGSLGSLIIWIPALLFRWPLWIKLGLLCAIFCIGVWASKYAISYYQKSDPPQVVIDEVVGQGIPFLVIGPYWPEILLAFLLFRFFDIVKPWPIKFFERQFPDAFGIMIDDVIAGIFAMAVIFIGKTIFL